jgi:threonine/homoserine/homoserine lactone efflux protein
MKKTLFIIGGIIGASAIIYFGYKMVKGNGGANNAEAEAAQKAKEQAEKAKEQADAKTASGGRGTGVAPDTRHQAVIRRDAVMGTQGRG